LGARPLARGDLLAEGGALLHRAGLAGVGAAPSRGVGARTVEGDLVGVAVALGDQEGRLAGWAGPLIGGQGAVDVEGTGLRAGLGEAELGVGRGVALSHGSGQRPR